MDVKEAEQILKLINQVDSVINEMLKLIQILKAKLEIKKEEAYKVTLGK